MKNFKLISFPAVLLALATSILSITYFTDLAQYGTADTPITLQRIQTFLNDRNAQACEQGGIVSNHLSALPAQLFASAVPEGIQSSLFALIGLQQNQYLVFTFFQVVLCLFVIGFAAWNLGCILVHRSLRLPAALILYLLLSSLPMFKGTIKVLKYDALSNSLTLIALAFSLRAIQQRSSGFAILGLGSAALAFIEKDTNLLVLALVLFILVLNFANNLPFKKALLSLAAFSGSALGFAALNLYLLCPSLSQPQSLQSYFNNFGIYVSKLSPASMSLISFGLCALIWLSMKNSFSITLKARLLLARISFVLILAAILMILLSQGNSLLDPHSKFLKLNLNELQMFQTPLMGNSNLAVHTDSNLIGRATYLWYMIKSLFYSVPEYWLILFVLTPLLYHRCHQNKDPQVQQLLTTFHWSLLFPLGIFAGYAVVLPPLDPKYLVGLSLAVHLCCLILCIPTFFLLRKRRQMLTVALIFPLITIASFAADPVHLSYKNLLRSRTIDSAESKIMGKYQWWMWMGWGETSYFSIRELEARNLKGIVAVDYMAPLYSPKDLSVIKVNSLQEAISVSADFFVASRNMIHRSFEINTLVRNFEHEAIYVHQTMGIAYGWLFSRTTLEKALLAQSPNGTKLD